MEQARTERERARRRAFRGVALAAIGGLALLLWARLKLVTDTPRMVYADPPVGAAETPGQSGAVPRAASIQVD